MKVASGMGREGGPQQFTCRVNVDSVAYVFVLARRSSIWRRSWLWRRLWCLALLCIVNNREFERVLVLCGCMGWG